MRTESAPELVHAFVLYNNWLVSISLLRLAAMTELVYNVTNYLLVICQ